MEVPARRSNVIPMQMVEKPDPIYLAMAAANMHEMGRLFEPEGTGNVPTRTNPQQIDEIGKIINERYAPKRDGMQPDMTPEMNDKYNGSAGTKRTG